MSTPHHFGRAALPVLALSLISVVFSGQADGTSRAAGWQGPITGIAGLPHLDSKPPPTAVPPWYNPRPREIARFARLIEEAAHRYGLDPLLLHAVIRAESGYNPDALSPRGATGLMQLLPDTARRYGVKDLYDPRQNVRAGARYLRDLLERFGNDLELALAGYNAGEGAVLRAGNRIPDYRETRAYVPKVLGFYRAQKEEEES
jgi:soluble lytic murein transglycosylase-like protein